MDTILIIFRILEEKLKMKEDIGIENIKENRYGTKRSYK